MCWWKLEWVISSGVQSQPKAKRREAGIGQWWLWVTLEDQIKAEEKQQLPNHWFKNLKNNRKKWYICCHFLLLPDQILIHRFRIGFSAYLTWIIMLAWHWGRRMSKKILLIRNYIFNTSFLSSSTKTSLLSTINTDTQTLRIGYIYIYI